MGPDQLYFAHGFTGRLDARARQERIEKQLQCLTLVNPFYDIKREDVEAIDKGLQMETARDPDELVMADLHAIEDCDGVLGLIDEHTKYGTPMELFFASFILHMPVFLLVLNGAEKHPWLRAIATHIETTEEGMINFLRDIHLQES